MKQSLRWYLLAGLCGGLAEVIWISLYSVLTTTSLTSVGRGISSTFWVSSVHWPGAEYLGLLIHLILSLILALGFGALLHHFLLRRSGRSMTVITAVLMLALIWKINFYVILPLWNPGFVNILPLSVTLVSKLLFGFSMGWVLAQYPDDLERS